MPDTSQVPSKLVQAFDKNVEQLVERGLCAVRQIEWLNREFSEGKKL